MLAPEQASAYADADFADSDNRFVARFVELFGKSLHGEIIDLGCGPGNITLRMSTAYPECLITGIEGAPNMLEIARNRAEQVSGSEGRMQFLQVTLPDRLLAGRGAVAVVSNSLLHHLHDPQVLWRSLMDIGAPGAAVLVADLRRPESSRRAREIVDNYARQASGILRDDYYNSLLAAFEVEEVVGQLENAGLTSLTARTVDDRYLEVSGRLPSRAMSI